MTQKEITDKGFNPHLKTEHQRPCDTETVVTVLYENGEEETNKCGLFIWAYKEKATYNIIGWK